MTFIENALNSFASNLGVSFPDLVVIIVVLGSIIIFGLNEPCETIENCYRINRTNRIVNTDIPYWKILNSPQRFVDNARRKLTIGAASAYDKIRIYFDANTTSGYTNILDTNFTSDGNEFIFVNHDGTEELAHNLKDYNDDLQAQLLLWVQGIFSIIATLVLIRFLLGVRTQSLGAV